MWKYLTGLLKGSDENVGIRVSPNNGNGLTMKKEASGCPLSNELRKL